jgi:hypothetical protein
MAIRLLSKIIAQKISPYRLQIEVKKPRHLMGLFYVLAGTESGDGCRFFCSIIMINKYRLLQKK